MPILMPGSLEELRSALAADPDAHLLAGGTDLMVEVNYAGRRPRSIIGLRRVSELRHWEWDGDELVIGAGCTWTDLMQAPLAEAYPALATAARTVGSPQIRNAGTLAGNIATASPAGDGLPPLYAADARVVISSTAGTRTVAIGELITGVKQTGLAPGELIEAVRLPRLEGPQEYCKVGTRNAMVISAAGVALIVDRLSRTVRCALGAVAPTVVRATAAEQMVSAAVDWEAEVPRLMDPTAAEHFGELAADAASPIDDHRSSAVYRRHAISVMARRALLRCL